MNFSGTKCDECGRIKGESNHWHQMGVYVWPASEGQSPLSVELGKLHGAPAGQAGDDYEIHDLCGEQCLYKHLGKLLKLNPVTEEN